ncbi:MAG: LSU ribosomal protein L11p (L12e), partial [uncultured Solirubrobacteraceae bacterium]
GEEGPHHDQAAGRRRPGHPGAAGRPRAGPARDQHHGVLQGVQRPDAERRGHDDPRRHHGLRGPLVHLRDQDPAGRGAHPPGHRDRQGLGRAQPDEGRDDHRGADPRDRREEARRPQRARRRPGAEDHRRDRPLDGRGGGRL